MTHSRWNSAPIFNTDSTWFREVVKRGEGMRFHADQNPYVSATCQILNLTMPLLGWHMSYAMGTKRSSTRFDHFQKMQYSCMS